MKRHLIINISPLVVILGLSLGIFACKEAENKEDKKASPPESVPNIPLIAPIQEKLITSIRIPGELQAFQQVDLYAKVNSFVSQLKADVGTEVQEGQLLAVLDAPELKTQENAASSRLQSQQAVYFANKATYERLLQTSKTPGTISPSQLEQAYARQQADSASLEAAKAAHREVLAMQEYLQIKAPFSGIITARNVSNGAFVGTSGKGAEQPIFTLVEQKKLRLVVSVPEAYSATLNKTGLIKFTVASFPNDTLLGKISRAAGVLDNRLRAQRIEIDVPNTDRRLLPGMVAEITIPLQSDENALTVPASAVLNSTLGTFVIRVKDKKAEWVPVKRGISDNKMTEILGQISAQDSLVKQASEEIRDGAALN